MTSFRSLLVTTIQKLNDLTPTKKDLMDFLKSIRNIYNKYLRNPVFRFVQRLMKRFKKFRKEYPKSRLYVKVKWMKDLIWKVAFFGLVISFILDTFELLSMDYRKIISIGFLVYLLQTELPAWTDKFRRSVVK